jgi:ribosomal protein S18 acetylase RimI-like enzyme
MIEIRFLENVDLSDLHQTFLRAFSDYLVPMNLNREQFEQLLERRGTRNEISVAAFDHNIPVGFTFNAFEVYRSVPTVYDVVTGVVPEARKKRVAQNIFEFALPKFKTIGAARYVLEVFESNLPALRLYQKLGFSISRKLEVFTRSEKGASTKSIYQMKEIVPDWQRFQTFWDWEPSWQNSVSSIQRSRARKSVTGVFHDSELIGYGIVFNDAADIPQFAIHPKHRRKGAGTALLNHLQMLAGDKTVRVVNVDGSADNTIRFLHSIGFKIFGRQNEMVMIF